VIFFQGGHHVSISGLSHSLQQSLSRRHSPERPKAVAVNPRLQRLRDDEREFQPLKASADDREFQPLNSDEFQPMKTNVDEE
jgi:hypothetical protein